MTNRTFDALFGAKDRDHELQFRMLFTPLAQENIQKLLQDKMNVGYGDDFTFRKKRKLNILTSKHFDKINLNGDPKKFHGYNFAVIKRNFIEYHNNLMHSLYFTLAPLLSIPLYLEKRAHLPDYGKEGNKASLWTCETIANSYINSVFAHSESCTRNILKAEIVEEGDAKQVVKIIARGYRTINRTSYISVYGNDGKYHNVCVQWDEYIPVERCSKMVIAQEKRIIDGMKNIKNQRGLFSAIMGEV